MAFCTKCGKKLDKNQKCDCEIINNIKEDNIDIINEIKEFIKKPIDRLKENNLNDISNYLLLIISSISFGLITDRLIFFTNSIVNIIFSFTFFLLLVCITTLTRKIIDNKDNVYSKNLNIVALSSIPLLFFNIIGFIVSYVSIRLVILIIILEFIIFLLYYYHGLYLSKQFDKNKVAYIASCNIVITFLITILLFSII